MQVSSLRPVKTKMVTKMMGESYHCATDSFAACVTYFAQSHTLFTCFFDTVLSTLCQPGYGFGS